MSAGSSALSVCKALELDPDTKVRDLTEEEIAKLRAHIDQNLEVEGDLRRERSQNVKRLMEIGCYRGAAPSARASRQWTAHEDERSHAQGPEEDRLALPQEVAARAATRKDCSNLGTSASPNGRCTRPHAP